MAHAGSFRQTARLATPQLAPWCAAALVALWALLMAATHPAQFSDSIEQYNWAHSLEWGYWKHPPLATWMMRGAITVLGVSHWTAPLLALACHLATVWLLWQLARALLSEEAASLAIILWPLNHALMWRAEVYNHNTVLILLSSAIAWAALRAWRSGALRDWLLLGLAAGLGMLAKYQAAVTVLGAVVALAACGAMRERRARLGLLAAAVVGLLVFLPHLVWAEQHNWPALRYLDDSAPVLPGAARVPAILRFFGSQLALLITMLVAAAAARFWPAAAPAGAPQPADARVAPWMFGLVALPLFAVAATVLAGGHTPQRMWGVHTTHFLPLWLAWAVERARPGARAALHAGIAGAVLVIGHAAYAVHEFREPLKTLRSIDRDVPAEQLAQAALADWRRATSCPLRFVVGAPFPAGLASVYSGTWVPVLEEWDFAKSPWVPSAQFYESGALELRGPQRQARVAPDVKSIEVPTPVKYGEPTVIWWRVHPPAHAC
jgi:4-amino-4-deoxy-L-arabinose transferase-like glycosyltransferase